MEQRLQRILAAAGVGSRRHCETIVVSGRVAVNGHVVTELGSKADPDKDTITLDGQPVGPAAEHIYILLNKPLGYTSTRSDPHAEHTVLELVNQGGAFLYPVGRLDVDTTGLLLLTNDGDLTKLLTHPSHEVEKTYRAVVRGRVTASELTRLERGIELTDGMTAPAKARLISYSQTSDQSTVEIVLREGRKRQVKRMLGALLHPVIRLVRIRFGNLDMKGLTEGHYRRLTRKEVVELRKLATSHKPAKSGRSAKSHEPGEIHRPARTESRGPR